MKPLSNTQQEYTGFSPDAATAQGLLQPRPWTKFGQTAQKDALGGAETRRVIPLFVVVAVLAILAIIWLAQQQVASIRQD